MAYSNWGAFVYRNGERRRDREDVPAIGDASAEQQAPSGARIFVNLIKLREQYGAADGPAFERCHHAVLGDGPIRLCGYKSYPVIFEIVDAERVVAHDAKKFRVNQAGDEDAWDWFNGEGISGELRGCRFKATPGEDPERVDLELVEPDGTIWKGTSGYGMGAGFEDE